MTSSEKAIRVLVVEDDPVAADAHVLYVGRVPGFVAVGKAHSGAEARRALERTPVDLLLLDLHLPDVPGEEVLRELRADARTAAIPVVVISADATGAAIARLRNAGADDYLTKPLDLEEFLSTVERYLPH